MLVRSGKPNKEYTKEEIDLILVDAKKAHTAKKDKAADVGTLVHKAVEEWVKEGVEPTLDEKGKKMF